MWVVSVRNVLLVTGYTIGYQIDQPLLQLWVQWPRLHSSPSFPLFRYFELPFPILLLIVLFPEPVLLYDPPGLVQSQHQDAVLVVSPLDPHRSGLTITGLFPDGLQ